MMKLIMILMFSLFLINYLLKFYYQLFYQNINFITLFMMIIMYPLNNMDMPVFIYYTMGVDVYSFSLMMLSYWIISLMMLTSNNLYKKINNKMFSFLISLMLFSLIMCFSSINMMMFYFFFELSLIPIFMMIMGWGYQIERIEAAYYLMIYTLFGSMPLFLMIMNIYMLNWSLMMNLISISGTSFYIYLSMMMAFLIKMPMYFFHMWLPKAHVEAPIMGSMILAGVLLKLGTYGLIRVLVMMTYLSMKFNQIFILISLYGSLIASLVCLLQVDMKKLVAYSSVVHMGSLMAGVMTMFNWGCMGGLLMMLAHGLCSSGMFCLVNISYERTNSRSLIINKGLINICPSLAMMWFLLNSSNLSFPPSLNLFSEIMLLCSLIMWSLILMLPLIFMMFFSACYTLYLYSYSIHGKLSFMNFKFPNVMEFMLLLFHWIPLNLMFMMMMIFN